jgi:hypothetical protein
MDLDYVLKFLLRPCTNGADLYLPSLKHITLSKITFTDDTFTLLENILRARIETCPCRLTFRGCRFLERYDREGVPQYCPFPDLHEFDLDEWEFAFECYLDELEGYRNRKRRKRVRDRMFRFDGTAVKLVGDLRTAARL